MPEPTSSVLLDPSSFAYVVGVDIGRETCCFTVLTPQKQVVVKPTDFANAAPGFALLHERIARLVLQLELGSIESETPLVMTCLGNGLMMSAKERPGYHVSDRFHLLPHQQPDQVKHFWQRVGDQKAPNPLRDLKRCKLLGPGLGSRAFFSCSALACSIMSVAQN